MSHHQLFTIMLVLSAAACGTPSTGHQPVDAVPVDGGPVQFKEKEISAESRGCTEPDGKCARVKVSYPETTGGGSAAVRDNIDLFIDHDLVSRMRSYVPEDVGAGIGDPEELAAAFLAQFRAYITEFPEATAEWYVEITAMSVYNTTDVSTLDITETAYTGGAHPNSRRRLVSFDVSTGQLLGADDLTTDIAELTALVENQLRIDRGLEPGADLEAAGFWFPEVGFTLPDNIGIVADGLLFHWDAYEIAPYSTGPVDVMIPVVALQPIINRDYW